MSWSCQVWSLASVQGIIEAIDRSKLKGLAIVQPGRHGDPRSSVCATIVTLADIVS